MTISDSHVFIYQHPIADITVEDERKINTPSVLVSYFLETLRDRVGRAVRLRVGVCVSQSDDRTRTPNIFPSTVSKLPKVAGKRGGVCVKKCKGAL